jgi:DNA-binding NarL/FixJ family response regulator
MRDYGLDSRGDSCHIRILLFNDCAKPKEMPDYDRSIRVIACVKTGDELAMQASATKPDAILMLTDHATPSADFTETLGRLHKASLAGRVAILAKHPAGYLRLAVKTRAAALLPLNVRYDDVISGISELSGASRHTVPSWHLLTDVGSCGPDLEVTGM